MVLSRPETKASDLLIAGTISICRQLAFALFDLGFTYSFVSVYFSPCLGLYLEPLLVSLCVSTPMGDFLVVDHVC